VALSVFTLWLDHGRHPLGTSYAYSVVPGVNVGELSEYAAQPRAEIITNTPSVQAVRHRASGVVEAVFRTAGSIQIPSIGTLTAYQPCALVFHPESEKVLLTAANPLSKGIQLHCVISPTDSGIPTEVILNLPSSPENAGRSVSVILPASKK
jgi:chondroitin AC lyase